MNTEAENGQSRSGMLNVVFDATEALYAAYMPFVKNGGLFIKTRRIYEVADDVFILLNLPNNGEKTPIPAKVVWVTPSGAQGNREQGIGVQFCDLGIARDRIETILAGALKSDRQTHTM